MPRTEFPKSHRPNHDVPEEWEPPELPIEPDEGLSPPLIPDDPEHERLIDPVAKRPQDGPRSREGAQVRASSAASSRAR